MAKKKDKLVESYWNGEGLHQKELDGMEKRLIPKVGHAPTMAGEILRATITIHHDHYCNGRWNMDVGGCYDWHVAILNEFRKKICEMIDLLTPVAVASSSIFEGFVVMYEPQSNYYSQEDEEDCEEQAEASDNIPNNVMSTFVSAVILLVRDMEKKVKEKEPI